MPRPSRLADQRSTLLPVIAAAFAELGYRRATTAALAQRCQVGENILYRHWPDKKAMFLAALDSVYVRSEETWKQILSSTDGSSSSFERLLAYESKHHGEHRLYRIVFAGLSETDDAEIRAALRGLYGRFHAFVRRQVESHRGSRARSSAVPADACAWAIVGLGTVANIARELGLLADARRAELLAGVGRHIAGDPAP